MRNLETINDVQANLLRAGSRNDVSRGAKGGTGQIIGKRANGEGNGKASNWGRVKDSSG
jgi:hypothetical protein